MIVAPCKVDNIGCKIASAYTKRSKSGTCKKEGYEEGWIIGSWPQLRVQTSNGPQSDLSVCRKQSANFDKT